MKKICIHPNILLFIYKALRSKFKIFVLLPLLLHPLNSIAQDEEWWNIEMLSTEDEYLSLSALEAENGILIFFMDSDCPVTQKYAATIREIYQTYRAKGIVVAAIYPVVNAETDKISEFAKDYKYPFTQLLDPKLKFTKAIGASVTPEVYLLDDKGNILYQGAIDNWFYELGRYRRVITKHYLRDALEAHLTEKEITVKQTEAVGCMIGTGMLHGSDHH